MLHEQEIWNIVQRIFVDDIIYQKIISGAFFIISKTDLSADDICSLVIINLSIY
ncbi:hypothetical protein SB5531_03564 [Klebsiella variicola]|nr:hypothetical protein SB5531_03564 [Klebsiella variicola]VGP99975.1 hypothetical protein SB5439_03625 [Klebsiella variicola]